MTRHARHDRTDPERDGHAARDDRWQVARSGVRRRWRRERNRRGSDHGRWTEIDVEHALGARGEIERGLELARA